MGLGNEVLTRWPGGAVLGALLDAQGLACLAMEMESAVKAALERRLDGRIVLAEDERQRAEDKLAHTGARVAACRAEFFLLSRRADAVMAVLLAKLPR